MPDSVTADALATAERVLRFVTDRARSAEAEVTVRTGTRALTRFANSFIHQNVAEELRHVALRVALDGHVAATSLDGPTDDATLGRLVDAALEAARVRPVDPDWPGLTPPTPVPDVDHWDGGTAAAGPDERARRVGAFVAAAGGLETAGFCSTDAIGVAFANSAGQQAAGRTTFAVVDGIARTGTADGSARSASVALGDLDGEAIGRDAARRARDASDPTDLAPGRYEVVLAPGCVADVLQFLFVHGFNGQAVEEGRSFVRLGEAQFDAAIDLRDDATDPGQAGVAFDAEGTPKRRIDVVRDGVTSAVLQTRRTAKRAGTESTGSAEEGGDSFGALPGNVVLRGGDASTADLIAATGRGLLVTDFWYTRILDPRTQVVTGLTRNGVWMIEDGRIARPVRNLRFTQSYVDALGPGAVLGIGRDRALVPGDWGDDRYLVPSVRLAGWNFTGGAKG